MSRNDIYIRSVPPTTAESFRNSAWRRRLSLAQYLVALYNLHQDARRFPDRPAGELLKIHGLGEIKE